MRWRCVPTRPTAGWAYSENTALTRAQHAAHQQVVEHDGTRAQVEGAQLALERNNRVMVSRANRSRDRDVACADKLADRASPDSDEERNPMRTLAQGHRHGIAGVLRSGVCVTEWLICVVQFTATPYSAGRNPRSAIFSMSAVVERSG